MIVMIISTRTTTLHVISTGVSSVTVMKLIMVSSYVKLAWTPFTFGTCLILMRGAILHGRLKSAVSFLCWNWKPFNVVVVISKRREYMYSLMGIRFSMVMDNLKSTI